MINLFFRASRFIPDEYHHSFLDVDYDQLYKNGIRYIIFDLDNTLIPYDESLPTKKILSTFSLLKSLGFNIIILSNNKPKRIETFVSNIDVSGIANARKPFKKGFKKALKLLDGANTTNTVIIGDQLVTDIYGAKKMKMYAILVDPIKKKTEKWYTKMNRIFEHKMLLKIKRQHHQEFVSLKLNQREG